jgi:hypothetical protein
MKTRKIKEHLEIIEKRLANAEKYVARNKNVRSSSQEDWNGKSGHPLWMKNQMVPSTQRVHAILEKRSERIVAKAKDKKSVKNQKRKSCELRVRREATFVVQTDPRAGVLSRPAAYIVPIVLTNRGGRE